MAQHVAIKPLTAMGKTYKPGQVVPMDKLPRGLQRKLIEHNRVRPDSARVNTGKGG